MNINIENLFFFHLETASVPLLDLGFAISASSQHAMKVFKLMKESIGRIIERYKTSNIRYALLTFGDFANRNVNFTSDPPSSEALKKSIENIRQPSGEPNLKTALEEAKMMFKEAPSRPGAKRVLVVIMDKKSKSDSKEVTENAKGLEDSNIKVVPVAIGSQASLSELEKVTTNKKFIVSVVIDEDPGRLAEEIIRKAVKSMYFILCHLFFLRFRVHSDGVVTSVRRIHNLMVSSQPCGMHENDTGYSL